MSKKMAYIALVVLGIIAVALTIYKLRPTEATAIRLNADSYLVYPLDTADGDVPEMSKDNVGKVSAMLSGEYKEKGYAKALEEEAFILCPVYKNIDSIEDIDDYAPNTDYYIDNDSEITYGEEIHIIDKKTIAVMDRRNKVFWVAKKTGDPIDLNFLERFLPSKEASGEDEEETSNYVEDDEDDIMPAELRE